MVPVQPDETNADDCHSGKVGYYTLSGDVNNDMVHRVFEATAAMTADGIATAHVLLQSHGGYISDGICLYNYLYNAPVRFIMYNAGVVASIAVTVFLAGEERHASETARFMLHKSHSSPPAGVGPEALRIITNGLMADDSRTEAIMRKHITLTDEQWQVHLYSDLHLTAEEAMRAGLVHAVRNFAPPPGCVIVNI